MTGRALMLAVIVAAAVGLTVLAGCEKEQEPVATPDPAVKTPAAATPTFVNVYCPIMTDNKIDPAKVTDDLVRDYRDGKVAFCCGGCPSKWDPLSDAGKTAKLAALPKE